MTASDARETASVISDSNSDVTIVDWDGPDDPENPFNWPKSRKWLITFVTVFTTFTLLMNGTIITVAHDAIDEQFHISEATFPHSYWPVTSWTLGGAFFSLIILPIMEDFGVRPIFLGTYLFFIIFVVPQAVAQNFATLIIVRFFAGGCVTVLANSTAGVISNVWETERERTKPVSLWILAYLGGSSMGPVVGAAIFPFLSWRWMSYLQLIWYGILFPLNFLVFKETRDSAILKQRAQRLRAKGFNAYTRQELEAERVLQILSTSIRRPLKMLTTEYVVFFSALWSGFTIGTLYLFTQSVELVFVGLYGWTPVQAGYVQAAVFVGQVIGWAFSLISERLYFNSASRNTEIPGVPIPEARIYLSVGGSIFGMGGGMFVYAWTSYPTIPWIAPAVGLAMVGAGSVVVGCGLIDYMVDAYSKYAGSAMAGLVLSENVLSGFLPLATMKMYSTLGFRWASTVLGVICLLITVAPLCIVIWGKKIREKSPFMKEVMMEKRAEALLNDHQV